MASNEAQNKAYADANAERMAQAEAIYLELEIAQKSEIQLEQEKYDEKLRLLQEYGNETESLTNAHEERMADIQRRIWVDRLSAAEGFFGGFAKLAAVAAQSNKEWANTAKALAIAEATMNTAVGITKAYAQGGVLGFLTGAGIAHVTPALNWRGWRVIYRGVSDRTRSALASIFVLSVLLRGQNPLA